MSKYTEKARYDLKLVRGETYNLSFNNWQYNGAPLNLSLCQVRVDVKREVNSTREPDLVMTVANGLLEVSTNNLKIKFGEETMKLGASKYYYDVLVIHPNGDRRIYIIGDICMSGTVTK